METKLKAILIEKYYNATKNHFDYLVKDNHIWSNFKLDIPTISNWKYSNINKNTKEHYTHYIQFYLVNYNFLANKEKYLKSKELIDIDLSINYPPFKYLIESATLGMTISFIRSLEINTHNLLKLVSKEFGIYNQSLFINYLNRLNEIRNRVFHGNRIFNRTFRSIKGTGNFKRLRVYLNNHKIIDVYLFLVYMLNGLDDVNSYTEFKRLYITNTFIEFKKSRFYNKSLQKLFSNLNDSHFKEILSLMEK